jgi:hypothetical protein
MLRQSKRLIRLKLLGIAEDKIKYNMVLRTYIVAYVRIALAISINLVYVYC